MDFLQAVILGVIQGVTEWLPISSSGHLVLAEHFFNLQMPLIFDVVIQLASVLVVLAVFWKDILSLIKGVLKNDQHSWRMVFFLIIASTPIALFGLLFHDFIESVFKSLTTVGFSLLFTSILLFLSRYPRKKTKPINATAAIGIGLAQALAIFPGVSRSGSTISAGMMLGFKREEVARFSFLMFIPAMIGAAGFEIYKGALSQIADPWMVLLSSITAVAAGFFSLKLLLQIIRKDLFSYFSIYCALLGIITLIVAFVA
ncbi:undecaprenyl-diphosphate phosphatase [Candidatus Woesearchaeota archaeon]|nr:undecaprenyl-diphosphate phosphatase [Candidatus Woesearchaeota archaeon]